MVVGRCDGIVVVMGCNINYDCLSFVVNQRRGQPTTGQPQDRLDNRKRTLTVISTVWKLHWLHSIAVGNRWMFSLVEDGQQRLPKVGSMDSVVFGLVRLACHPAIPTER